MIVYWPTTFWGKRRALHFLDWSSWPKYIITTSINTTRPIGDATRSKREIKFVVFGVFFPPRQQTNHHLFVRCYIVNKNPFTIYCVIVFYEYVCVCFWRDSQWLSESAEWLSNTTEINFEHRPCPIEYAWLSFMCVCLSVVLQFVRFTFCLCLPF